MHAPTSQEEFKAQSLELLGEQLKSATYPGYPSFCQRLYWRPPLYNDEFNLPGGPWEVNGGQPNDEEYLALQGLSLAFDAHRRPLHPWLGDMITSKRIGAVSGRGFYWKWGPNRTADPIVVRHDQPKPMVLLIKRGDTGHWALPGGFVDPGETPLQAAIRETNEEAGIDLAQFNQTGVQVYDGPLADVRVTAHAWPHTTAFRFDLEPDTTDLLPTGITEGYDDATLKKWEPIDNISETLFGSHRLLIALSQCVQARQT